MFLHRVKTIDSIREIVREGGENLWNWVWIRSFLLVNQ